MNYYKWKIKLQWKIKLVKLLTNKIIAYIIKKMHKSRIKTIFEYHEMISTLVKRDLRGRYKGSVLGFFWTFLNPLLQLIVYTIVFSVIMRSNIENYYIFLFVALVPWMFFSSGLTAGCSCVFMEQNMVKKIYFPREVLPISFTTTAFVNMLLTFIVVFVVLIVSGFGINLHALPFLIPIFIVEYILVLGTVMLTSALSVYFRDLQYILGIIGMLWQFLTPIMYSQESVDIALQKQPHLAKFWNLNPMTPVINAYRQILYYKQIPNLETLLNSIFMGIIVLLIGWTAFGILQKGFAEEM